jgi:hypothetical protein
MEKPDKSKYHYTAPKPCPPIVGLRGCFGDCVDCFQRDMEAYERQLPLEEDYSV